MTGESTPGRTRRAVGDRRLVALAKEMGVLAAKVIDPAPADVPTGKPPARRPWPGWGRSRQCVVLCHFVSISSCAALPSKDSYSSIL